MTRIKTALVLGATGGIGGAVASRLETGGWTVRGMTRDPQRTGRREGIDWLAGDALHAGDVRAAAAGVDLIVHAVNPPGYRHWGRLVLPMLASTIAAAEAEGARILLPGTVYNYGPETYPLIDELAPQHPVTRKGAIRAEMERRLAAAVERGRAKALIVRAGDYFGPRAGNNWFSQALVSPGARPRAITYPGRPGIGHQWAYLPDVAETMVRLVDRDDLAPFATYHMEGHWDADGTAMVQAIRGALDAPDLPVKALPWTLMRLAGPVVPLFRELAEMRHLWSTPVRLDNRRLVAKLGSEPRTPLDVAVRATLADIGRLEDGRAAQMPADPMQATS